MTIDQSSARRLTTALLEACRDGQLPDALVSDQSHAAEFASRLAAVAAAGEPTITWVGVNDERVDVVVRAGAGEWRVVFGCADASRVDWLHVFERPPIFEGVRNGRAVIVNGPSGAGKSAVMDAIRIQSLWPWVVFDEPILGLVDQRYLIWREQAESLHAGFLNGIAAVARAGNYVTTAAAGHPQSLFHTAFAGVPVLYVGLHCDRDTLLARGRGREGRWGGLAESSFGVHTAWTYDMEFDTVELRADEIAATILLRLTDAAQSKG